MNFLIQGTNGLPDFDFGYELIKSIEFQDKELGNYSRLYEVTEYPQIKYYSVDDYKAWCPVGSVEFVHKYFENYNIPIPKPINIPKELWDYSNLRPKIVASNYKSINPIFVKNIDKIKHSKNGVAWETSSEDTYWQVTTLIEEGFLSEWRCFIFNGKLLDCKLYSGDWNSEPPREFYIEGAIKTWKSAPCAYTLDIGTIFNGWTGTENCIIEAHNLYSCGLYGFSNRFKYPQMLSQWYSEWLRKNINGN